MDGGPRHECVVCGLVLRRGHSALVGHVRLQHPRASMAELAAMGMGRCSLRGGCGNVHASDRLPAHLASRQCCRRPRGGGRPAGSAGRQAGGRRGREEGAGGHPAAEGDRADDPPAAIPDEAWEWLGSMGFADIVPSVWPSMVDVPHRARDPFAECMQVALQRMLAAPESADGLKLALLAPQLLLRPLPPGEKGVQRVVIARCRAFLRGEWEELLMGPRGAARGRQPERVLAEVTLERAAKDACRLAKEGEFRRAVQRLQLAHLAPPTAETVEALHALHPPANGTVEVMAAPSGEEVEAPVPIEVQREHFEAAVASLPRGSAPGPSQLRYEHLRVVHSCGGGDLLFQVVRQLAVGTLPEEARPWFGAARLVALLKDRDDDTGEPIPPPLGGVRPIACGEILRKLVAKAICQQEASRFRAHLCPDAVAGEVAAVTQVGVAVPGGADRVVHQTRALMELHPDWVVVKVDAKNAFNTLSRRAMLSAVRRHFPSLAPFVDLCYEHDTPLFFRRERGHTRLESREGTHQGDPLGCLLLSLPLHDVLRAIHVGHPEVVITAYIDDVFLVGPRVEVAAAYRDLVTGMERHLGLVSQARKCAVYSPAGGLPQDLFPEDMPGAGEVAAAGVEVLGVPIGSDAFVQDFVVRRVRQLDQIIPVLAHMRHPQLQYLLLRCCANARVSHLLRGVPPPLVAQAAAEHDRAVWAGLQAILPGPSLSERAGRVARLHIRLGGLGLPSAERLAPAAYLGSWAQVTAPLLATCPPLHAMGQGGGRLPAVRAIHLAYEQHIVPAMAHLQRLRAEAEREGAVVYLPPHTPAADSVTPPEQFLDASLSRAQSAYASALLARDWCGVVEGLEGGDLAWFLAASHHSIGGQFLMAVPRLAHFEMGPAVFQTAVRYRLREAQPVVQAVPICGGCGGDVDPEATHYVRCRGVSGGGGQMTALHHSLVWTLVGMLRAVHGVGRVLVEDRAGAPHYSPSHRPDITVLDTDGVGAHTLVEVTVFRPAAPTYQRGRARRPVGADILALQERRRRVDYSGLSGPHRLVVFALADYGMLSPDASQLFRACAVERGDRLDVEGDLSTWACRSFTAFWRQRLSVVLATGLAESVLRQAQRDWRLG